MEPPASGSAMAPIAMRFPGPTATRRLDRRCPYTTTTRSRSAESANTSRWEAAAGLTAPPIRWDVTGPSTAHGPLLPDRLCSPEVRSRARAAACEAAPAAPGRPACRCLNPAQGAVARKTRTPGSVAVVEGHLVAVGV